MKPYKMWTTTEARKVREMWAAGFDAQAISSVLPGRSRDSVHRYALRLALKRPESYRPPRPHTNWDQIEQAMRAAGEAMTVVEIVEASGIHKAVVYKLLTERRGKVVYVADWSPTMRKPAAVWALGKHPDAEHPKVRRALAILQRNPFAAAAGLIPVPTGQVGRVYRIPMSIKDDEFEEAA